MIDFMGFSCKKNAKLYACLGYFMSEFNSACIKGFGNRVNWDFIHVEWVEVDFKSIFSMTGMLNCFWNRT